MAGAPHKTARRVGGAHSSLPDLLGFGRCEMRLEWQATTAIVPREHHPLSPGDTAAGLRRAAQGGARAASGSDAAGEPLCARDTQGTTRIAQAPPGARD